MTSSIYLDYAATTPVDPRVAEVMLRYMTPKGAFGNASSTHLIGQAAKNAVDEARAAVANVLAAHPEEIIWTSGATEAINLALKGASQLYQQKGKHIVTVRTEHSAVLECCQQLEKEGFFVTYLTPETDGLLNLDAFKSALRDDTMLVSVMQVNNETGVIQDIDAIAQLTAERGILLHVDAAQSIGKIPLNVQQTPVDLVSLSAHKVYGPKGMGALYVRRKPRVRVAAQIHGGGHEQGMRSGTLPVHQIVGMGHAFALVASSFAEEQQRIAHFKQDFYTSLKSAMKVKINGSFKQAVPHILNLYFPHFTAKALMQALPTIAISAGSACHAKGTEPSYVLRAMGLSVEEAHHSLRFSFGRFTTRAEVAEVIECIIALNR